MSDDPRCAKCGKPRSNHPYRHMFVGPSRDDTIKMQADRIEELGQAKGDTIKGFAMAKKKP